MMTGVLEPIACDFDRRFDVGSIDGPSSDGLRSHKRMQSPALQALIDGALGLQDMPALVHGFDHCTRLAERAWAPRVSGARRHLPIVDRASSSPRGAD